MSMFYLGTHVPHWLDKTSVPLFISNITLSKRRSLPRAVGRWALDSGGFSEISQHGHWRTSAAAYAAHVRRYTQEIGGMEWAAIQDWMCEPFIVGKTGLSVVEHQRRTINSYLELREIAPELPWTPVLQGWSLDDYLRHIDDYMSAGVDLRGFHQVGVGSICRRQGTKEAAHIIKAIHTQGIKIHGFGFKLTGLARVADYLVSSDSMAWSAGARYAPALPGHTHKNCANCMEYALMWYHNRVMPIIECGSRQKMLDI